MPEHCVSACVFTVCFKSGLILLCDPLFFGLFVCLSEAIDCQPTVTYLICLFCGGRAMDF